MRKRKIVVGLLAAVLLMGMIASSAMAQGMGRGRSDRGNRGERSDRGGRGDWDPTQMQQRYMERIQEILQAGDEEWKVLQPRLEKVMELSRETRMGGMGGMMMGARRRGPGDNAAASDTTPAQPQSAMQKAHQALQATLENSEATADEIKAKLTALRTAREKGKQELAKAQQSLRELLTQRQEAQLVLMGMLD